MEPQEKSTFIDSAMLLFKNIIIGIGFLCAPMIFVGLLLMVIDTIGLVFGSNSNVGWNDVFLLLIVSVGAFFLKIALKMQDSIDEKEKNKKKESFKLVQNKKIKEDFNNIENQKVDEFIPNSATIIDNSKPKVIESQEENFNYLKQTEIKEPPVIESEKVEKKSFWTNLIADARVEIEKANNPSVKSEARSEKVKEATDIINAVPPEKLYRTPRKIDWEKVNKTKAITGMKGEEIVLAIEQDYLKSVNREDLAEKVKHISKEGDGSGYDILSFFSSGQEKYIEVKSTIKSGGNSFYLSKNELEFLKKNKYRAHIYRVFNVNDNDEAPSLSVHSAEDILMFNQITPTQYIVKME